jgi:hypothetical protein
MYTMCHLLMITLVRLGLKSKDEVLGKFKEFKALVENSPKENSRYSGLIMEESTPQMILESFAEMSGLRGSSPLLKILNKMV